MCVSSSKFHFVYENILFYLLGNESNGQISLQRLVRKVKHTCMQLV